MWVFDFWKNLNLINLIWVDGIKNFNSKNIISSICLDSGLDIIYLVIIELTKRLWYSELMGSFSNCSSIILSQISQRNNIYLYKIIWSHLNSVKVKSISISWCFQMVFIISFISKFITSIAVYSNFITIFGLYNFIIITFTIQFFR